jgi:NAD(P)-dependent dehydrogenase (short-subunit alcohol dehydrogenase family)
MNAEPSKTAIVTGATGSIGFAIAAGIARERNFRVVLVCRDEGRGRRAADAIRRATGSEAIRYEIADLSRDAEVNALASRWHEDLHVLVNNAAVAPPRRTTTPEGLELQFATNVMGYVWMMEAFHERLQRCRPARVVNVASYWAGDLDLSDLQFERRRYDNDRAYRQSKQANRMLTAAYAERFAADGITVNSCHPGDVRSRLSHDLGFGGHETPEEGARTPVWLATHPTAGEVTGKYFERMREVPCRFTADSSSVRALHQLCQLHVG